MRTKIALALVGMIFLAVVVVGLARAAEAPKAEASPANAKPEKSARPGMALIPAGCFDLGSAFRDEHYTKVHNVCLTSDYFMDVHEATNAEYAACVGGGGCTAPAKTGSQTRASYYGNPAYANFPVIYVNWGQAKAFCAWAGKRLPSEAEWEYAARGGLSGKRYPWGDSISAVNANYATSGSPENKDTTPVGRYAPNGYGLYDMSGNVAEWANDWYDSHYFDSRPPPDNNPPGPTSGSQRVLRGGDWYGDGTSTWSIGERGHSNPASQHKNIGFRCAAD